MSARKFGFGLRVPMMAWPSKGDVMEKKSKTRSASDRLAGTTRTIRRKELAPKFTIEEAFDYDEKDCVADAVKGTLAVAYLLDSISLTGMNDIDGRIAQGLAYALRHYAGDVGKYLKPIAPYATAEDQTGGRS